MGLGGVGLRRDTVAAITRQNISWHAAPDNTFAGQTGDVRNTGERSAILPDRR